jgi:hypothetical protein
MLQTDAGQPEAELTELASPRFGHDFSRIPVHPSAAGAIQTKLAINKLGDSYEQEADRMAEQVMRTPEPQLQLACPCGGGCPKCHTEQPGREHESLQTKRVQASDTGQIAAPPIVHEVLRSPGQPLDPATRAFMEPRFGHDFSRIRIHADSKAAAAADAVDALAYTAGRNLVFGAGQYAPGTPQGARLLAHELTHSVQQGTGAPTTIQRAMKFEIQTQNYVWAVKNSPPAAKGATKKAVDPDPTLLPRRFSPSSKSLTKTAGSEAGGDTVEYLSIGRSGGPARTKGDEEFVEARGELTTEDATKDVDNTKSAQFYRKYKFKKPIVEKDLIGEAVKPGQLVLVDERDLSKFPSMVDKINPNTFELDYYNADDTKLDVHLDEDGIFQKGHIIWMKVGRKKRKDIKKKRAAEHIEIWKVIPDKAGAHTVLGNRANIELAESSDSKADFNAGTWEKSYFWAKDFDGKKLKKSAKRLDVHREPDGVFEEGHVKFMEKKAAKPGEQTAIELQSEAHGFLEFETPKWFRDWTELKARLDDAVEITDLLNAQAETPDTEAVDAIHAKGKRPASKVVEWPAELDTSHLTNLAKMKRRLLVEIFDTAWPARIQASEGIRLSEFETLLREHRPEDADVAVNAAQNAFDAAFTVASKKTPSLKKSHFQDLNGFLQLIATYIVSGQTSDRTNTYAKGAFLLMARTNFASMYKNLLNAEEQDLYKAIVTDKAALQAFLTELEAPINEKRATTPDEQGPKDPDTHKPTTMLAAITLTTKSHFFFRKAGSDPKTASQGPQLGEWLTGIKDGKDKLSGAFSSFSGAMGARKVSVEPGDKSFKLAEFEVRGTSRFGSNDKKAKEWVDWAKKIFESAEKRSADTPDDPATPGVDESAKTKLKE